MIIVFYKNQFKFKGTKAEFLKNPECNWKINQFLKQPCHNGQLADMIYKDGDWEIYKIGSDD